MSTILLLCVFAAAVWVVLSFAGRSTAGRKDSVADFSRALSALSPEPAPEPVRVRRPAPRRRPARPSPRPMARR